MPPCAHRARGEDVCPPDTPAVGVLIDSLRALTYENMCARISIMDKEVIARVLSEVERIARGVGFGQVTIVIEKGRPRWIEAGTREWLEQREGAPPGRVRSELQM